MKATIGERLMLALAVRDKTGADLARGIGANSGLVSKWALDQQLPKADSIARICLFLEISAHWLVLGVGPMEAPGTEAPDSYESGRLAGRAEVVREVAEAIEPYGKSKRRVTESAEDEVDPAKLVADVNAKVRAAMNPKPKADRKKRAG